LKIEAIIPLFNDDLSVIAIYISTGAMSIIGERTKSNLLGRKNGNKKRIKENPYKIYAIFLVGVLAIESIEKKASTTTGSSNNKIATKK
jgi:hypothetical protein